MQFKFTVSDAEHAAYIAAANDAMLPVNTWARTLLTTSAKPIADRLAREAARSQPASASRKVDARTSAKYAEIVKTLAERGRTVPQWYEGQLRDKLLSAADRAHADKMLEIFHAEQGE